MQSLDFIKDILLIAKLLHLTAYQNRFGFIFKWQKTLKI